MTLTETKKLLALIQTYYPRFADGRDFEVTAKGWQMIFADEDFDAAQKGLVAYVASDVRGFPPMPGAIRQRMRPKEAAQGAFEAWTSVRRALCNSLYGSREEFEKLTPLCRRLVGSPAVLREWAMMDIQSVDTVIGSHFQRSYRELAQREKDMPALPQAAGLGFLPGTDPEGLPEGDEEGFCSD